MSSVRFTFVLLLGSCASYRGVLSATSIPFSNQIENSSSSFGDPSEPVISIKNSTKLYSGRYARLLSIDAESTIAKSIEDNEIENTAAKDDFEDPAAPLYDIYSDCLLKLSFQCVQRKLLVFLDHLGRMKSFKVMGDVFTVVRTKKETGTKINESDLEARLNSGEISSSLISLLLHQVEDFLQSHVIRISLPSGITASVTENSRSSSSLGNTVDIDMSRALGESTARGKDKKMKKVMSMLMTGMMGKMAFMGPMMLMLIKLKALKALILSKIALILALFQLFKSGGSKKGGGDGGGHGKEVIIVHDSHGGGGHDSHGSSGWASGGGGGGWDSYSQGPHQGGGDATYAGSDQGYSSGGNSGGWGNAGAGSGSHGWGRRSANDPHLVAYRGYVTESDKRK